MSLSKSREVLVEIGVFEGRTSLSLRQAMDDNARLFLIDPFPKGKYGFCSQYMIMRSMIRKCARGNLQVIRDFSYNAVRCWHEKIDFIFWDAVVGDREQVKRDFEDWSPFLASDGLYLLHGSRSTAAYPLKPGLGAIEFISTFEQDYPDFMIREQVETISCIVRRN